MMEKHTGFITLQLQPPIIIFPLPYKAHIVKYYTDSMNTQGQIEATVRKLVDNCINDWIVNGGKFMFGQKELQKQDTVLHEIVRCHLLQFGSQWQQEIPRLDQNQKNTIVGKDKSSNQLDHSQLETLATDPVTAGTSSANGAVKSILQEHTKKTGEIRQSTYAIGHNLPSSGVQAPSANLTMGTSASSREGAKTAQWHQSNIQVATATATPKALDVSHATKDNPIVQKPSTNVTTVRNPPGEHSATKPESGVLPSATPKPSENSALTTSPMPTVAATNTDAGPQKTVIGSLIESLIKQASRNENRPFLKKPIPIAAAMIPAASNPNANANVFTTRPAFTAPVFQSHQHYQHQQHHHLHHQQQSYAMHPAFANTHAFYGMHNLHHQSMRPFYPYQNMQHQYVAPILPQETVQRKAEKRNPTFAAPNRSHDTGTPISSPTKPSLYPSPGDMTAAVHLASRKSISHTKEKRDEQPKLDVKKRSLDLDSDSSRKKYRASSFSVSAIKEEAENALDIFKKPWGAKTQAEQRRRDERARSIIDKLTARKDILSVSPFSYSLKEA